MSNVMPKLLALHQPLDGNHEFWVDGQYIGNCQKPEHAQHIVKCVNMHDELVTALNAALVALTLGEHVDSKAALDYGMDVIAKAEGREE